MKISDIETARLQLTQFVAIDLDRLYRIYSNPKAMQYVEKSRITRDEMDYISLSVVIGLSC